MTASSEQGTPSSASTRSCATGRQYELRRGDAVAVVTELAAGLRSFSRGGTLLTETYGDDQIAPGGAGITLAPWANRVEDGQWLLDGGKQQLDITEVSRNNASHGLLRNTGYAPVGESQHTVALEATVFPQHGYPFLVRHRVEYKLSEDLGLQVRQTLTNDSAAAAPFVLGAHPYLRLGDAPVEELQLTVAADTRLVTDERLIPRSSAPVDGDVDFRSGRRIADLAVDVALTDLHYPAGKARHTLAAADGSEVSLWQDEACRYVHIYVSTVYPGRTRAVAVEPMTGPANAFNSGDGLRWLPPGESFSIEWGIDYKPGAAAQ
ncbi:aldose 1-epimerase family protein [Arthrobacter sp. B1I2]|uniref:aldose 1-epimerase family protein n=1 Tax=Arthrobacter sp. B1I2 TaxID=3042263 RepID=UPI0027B9AF2A|nr:MULTISPECIES: aldose 1-epimerase family protein [Arthrobacter]